MRQQKMDLWYRDLRSRPTAASQCFDHDYIQYTPVLATLRGLVLDIGGGNGIIRHYLSPDARYVNLEPSLAWLEPEWAALTDDFPCLSRSLPSVNGLGEMLPFTEECFDAAVSFWSLNHSRHPQAVLAEAHRVLKPAGLFLVVLEDMEPGWLDLMKFSVTRQRSAFGGKDFARKVVWSLQGKKWTLQDDHIRITEPEFLSWVAGRFIIVRRWWIKRYLNVELKRL
ncbi:MAG: class I SAM-dependent methyltransferase [Nitrospirales bacterium]